MFISIPKEFFVPVIFSDGFILNQENDHLELDTNLYRKSSESEKYSEIQISKKANLDESLNVNNELNNFVLPVVVSEEFLKELFDSIHADPKMEVEVNLPEQTITNKATGKSEHFEINAYKKHCLMNGLDDIDFLLTNKDKIEAWEKASK